VRKLVQILLFGFSILFVLVSTFFELTVYLLVSEDFYYGTLVMKDFWNLVIGSIIRLCIISILILVLYKMYKKESHAALITISIINATEALLCLPVLLETFMSHPPFWSNVILITLAIVLIKKNHHLVTH